jgi:N-acetylated-alpha-linked acidic dipeptidase
VAGNKEVDSREDLRISPLGSGSDYTPFIQHLGIASLNIGFGGESGGGSYHSTYDSFDHYIRFGDPEFAYGVALANVTGRAVLRLANADVLPFTFNGFVDNVSQYADEVIKLADDTRAETDQQNKLIEQKAYNLSADPTETYIPPSPEAPVPYFNFAPLQNAMAQLKESAQDYDKALAANGMALTEADQERLNEALMQIEQAMTREEGLPRRFWFRHQIYAPGFYTGYGVKTLPGIREALEERKWDEASEQIVKIAETIQQVSAAIDEATVLLGS